MRDFKKMTTAQLTGFYCAFCETVNNIYNKIEKFCVKAGTLRAARELERMGYSQDAKKLFGEQ